MHVYDAGNITLSQASGSYLYPGKHKGEMRDSSGTLYYYFGTGKLIWLDIACEPFTVAPENQHVFGPRPVFGIARLGEDLYPFSIPAAQLGYPIAHW